MITGEFIVPRETPPKEQRTEETDMMRIPELF